MKAFTDIEQSKKLAKILPLDSADMYYYLDPTPAGNIYHLTVQRVDFGIKNLPQYNEGDIPCWSLTALLKVIPYPTIEKWHTDDSWVVSANSKDNKFLDAMNKEDLIDACVELIVELHKDGLL